MKTTTKLLALAMLGACLFAAAAYAEPPYAGKFTLAHEVRWGKAVLPAGQYWLRLQMLGMTPIVTIRNAKNSNSYVMPLGSPEETVTSNDTLVIVTTGGRSSVRELRLGSVGIAFRYQPAQAREREAIREAHVVETVTLAAPGR